MDPEDPSACYCTLERSGALKSDCLRVSLCIKGLGEAILSNTTDSGDLRRNWRKSPRRSAPDLVQVSWETCAFGLTLVMVNMGEEASIGEPVECGSSGNWG